MSAKRHRLVWTALAAVALVAVGAGIAYAAIPGADGVIHGCYVKNVGVLRVIDPATHSCKSFEQAIEWNQTGPPGLDGEDGEDGSAAGYVRVTAPGAVDPALSSNIGQANVTHPSPGLYCIGGLPFTPRAAVATGTNGIGVVGNDTLATVAVAVPGVTFPAGCAETDVVRVRTIAATVGSEPVDRGFFLWLED